MNLQCELAGASALELDLARDKDGQITLHQLAECVTADEKSKFAIVTVSQRCGVTLHTVRFYEKRGLIRP